MSKTATYALIETITVSGTTTNDVSFTNIPARYTDLIIVKNSSSTAAAIKLLNFNGDTASNYSYTSMEGDGSTAQSHRGSSNTNIASYMVHENATRSTDIYHIMDYANTTTFKTVLMRLNNTGFGTEAKVGIWRKTPEAITSVRIFLDRAEYWTAGSTFRLYGIQAGNA